MDEWENSFSDEDEQQEELSEKLQESLALEREATLDLELEREEQRAIRTQNPPEPPERKRLKREIEREALARLESAARTVSEWQNVIAWWDRLDENRERRERYHEISRSGDDLPIDFDAKEDGLRFPDTTNTVLDKQVQMGDFIENTVLKDYEEFQTDPFLSKVLYELSLDHKEILYFSAVRQYSSQKIAELRGQTDRNIRKVKKTLLKKIHKKILPYLKAKVERRQPLTLEERAFLARMRGSGLDV